MSKVPVTCEIRGRRFFVCQYTGALITTRFFVPTGNTKLSKGKEGCYATLPVALRAVFEEEGNQATDRFKEAKDKMEQFFNQPNIPMQQDLATDFIPLQGESLTSYLSAMEMGLAWLDVQKGVHIDSVKFQGDKSKRHKSDAE